MNSDHNPARHVQSRIVVKSLFSSTSACLCLLAFFLRPKEIPSLLTICTLFANNPGPADHDDFIWQILDRCRSLDVEGKNPPFVSRLEAPGPVTYDIFRDNVLVPFDRTTSTEHIVDTIVDQPGLDLPTIRRFLQT